MPKSNSYTCLSLIVAHHHKLASYVVKDNNSSSPSLKDSSEREMEPRLWPAGVGGVVVALLYKILHFLFILPFSETAVEAIDHCALSPVAPVARPYRRPSLFLFAFDREIREITTARSFFM